MQPKSSKSFLAEVKDRVLKLQQASNETGLDLASDLLKTLSQLSEITQNQSSDSLNYSNIDEFDEIPQPSNSFLSISNSDPDLISNIKRKNSELKKNCSEKLVELRSTTKEFCLIGQNSRMNSVINEELTAERTVFERDRAHTLPDYPVQPLEMIYSELRKIKLDLDEANRKIVDSQCELVKQKSENFELKDQIHELIEAKHETQARKMCECLLF